MSKNLTCLLHQVIYVFYFQPQKNSLLTIHIIFPLNVFVCFEIMLYLQKRGKGNMEYLCTLHKFSLIIITSITMVHVKKLKS